MKALAGCEHAGLSCQRFFAAPLDPTLSPTHVRPPFVPRQMTNYLIESFDDPLVINHTKGHVIPQLPRPDLQRLKDFIREQQKSSSL